MATIKLTEALIRRVLSDPVTSDTSYFDIELPRFALRLRPGGRGTSASYFVRYIDAVGRERRAKVGSPATLTLVEARKAARRILADVDRGGDPAADKRTARQQLRLRDVTEKYVLSREWQKKTEATRRSDDIRLYQHILHRLGTQTIPELRPPTVRKFLEDVRTDTRMGKRGKRLGGDGTARKCLRLLTAIVSWAVGNGYAEVHPFKGTIPIEGDGSREAVLTDPAEYERLFSTMEEMVLAGELRKCAQAFFVLLAFTGMRRGEALSLTWGQVDLDKLTITLPTSKGSRLSRSGSRAETVGVPSPAVAVIGSLWNDHRHGDLDLVFPPTRGKQMETSRLWKKVRDRSRLNPDLTIHGLRHSAGTMAALNGQSSIDIQALLRHRQPGTTARYIKIAEIARQRPADKLADAILRRPSGG